jgi:hypothetical protein
MNLCNRVVRRATKGGCNHIHRHGRLYRSSVLPTLTDQVGVCRMVMPWEEGGTVKPMWKEPETADE